MSSTGRGNMSNDVYLYRSTLDNLERVRISLDLPAFASENQIINKMVKILEENNLIS